MKNGDIFVGSFLLNPFSVDFNVLFIPGVPMPNLCVFESMSMIMMIKEDDKITAIVNFPEIIAN